ncbi:MAG TPA: HEAT repeat domain-containing protein [Planctomycetota bacterium]|nr:HEAT repeat domain-containing protein [Planctomycetota bacterium]
MTLILRLFLVLTFSLLVWGCGTGKPQNTPQLPAPVPAAEKTQEKPPEAPFFTADGAAVLRNPFQKCVEASTYWRAYIQQKKNEGARRPYLAFSLTSSDSGTDRGGIASVMVKIKLAMSDPLSRKELYDDEVTEDASNPTMNSKSLLEEHLKTLGDSRMLALLADRAALVAMAHAGGEIAADVPKILSGNLKLLTPALLKSLVAARPDAAWSLPLLKNALRSRDARVRLAVLQELPAIKLAETQQLELYQELLDSSDAAVRLEAVKQLQNLGPSAGALLAYALLNDDEAIRVSARNTLLEWGPEARKATPVLLQQVGRDQDKPVRSRALSVLASIGGEESAAPLAQALVDQYVETGWAVEKLCALGEKAKPAVPVLEHAFKVTDTVTRQNVLLVLQKLGPENAAFIANQGLTDMEKEVQTTASKLLTEIGPDAVKPLAELMSDTRYSVRRMAVMTMGKIGPPAIEPLKAALADTDEEVRARAKSALSEMKVITVKPRPLNAWDKVEDPDKPKPASYKTVTTRDGKKLLAEKVVDFGDSYSIKLDTGKFLLLKKSEIEKIE